MGFMDVKVMRRYLICWIIWRAIENGRKQTISDLQPDAAVISDGLSISRNSVSGAESDVADWVNSLNLTAE